MKKIILGSLIALAPLTSFADDGFGCGLGESVMEGQSGVLAHILAGTTNGFFGSQTFGVISGTSGCDSSIPVGATLFIEENVDKLALDFSRGEGENLDALAQLLEIDESANFNAFVKTNFSSIYSAESTGSDVLSALIEVMKQDEQFSNYVS